MDKKLSTSPYKGVSDFYPEDFYVFKTLFNKLRGVVESYGYVEYGASTLEPTDLYRAKTGDEIVNEQTYSFIDRGGRDVTLRPEMTPSLARMVAGRMRELTFPLRWYSIANFFRYERPQRGRSREFWQLNVDIFGISGVEAELEIISLANDFMRVLSADDNDFVIRINNRRLLSTLFRDELGLESEKTSTVMKLIDRKSKLNPQEFATQLSDLLGDSSETVEMFLNAVDLETCVATLPSRLKDTESIQELRDLLKMLKEIGVTNARFDPSLVRGFDYYNGIVFEVFDTNPKNKRALFGGGRYDGLTEIFGADSVYVTGFAVGDIGIRNFLETRNKLPRYKGSAQLYLCATEPAYHKETRTLARQLRRKGYNVERDLTEKRIGDQIRIADKKKIPFAICIGEKEAKSETYIIKNLATSEETTATVEEIPAFLERHSSDSL